MSSDVFFWQALHVGTHVKGSFEAPKLGLSDGWLWRIRDKDRECGCKLEEISVQELAAAKLLQFGLYGPPADAITHDDISINKNILIYFHPCLFCLPCSFLLCNDGNGIVAQQLARLEVISNRARPGHCDQTTVA